MSFRLNGTVETKYYAIPFSTDVVRTLISEDDVVRITRKGHHRSPVRNLLCSLTAQDATRSKSPLSHCPDSNLHPPSQGTLLLSYRN